IPVLIHFGIMGAAGGIASHVNMSPMAIHDAAKRFPRLPFIVPHFGTGYLFELLNLCWACPNVFIDTSGSNQWMRWMPFEVTLESLFRKFRETTGTSRILFGTDSSWFPRGFTKAYLDAQLRAMGDVGYTEDEKDQVLYRNAAWLLGIDPSSGNA
ncbi:MAG: amidohydrolase family protein, partial [Spirochaetes bacterium]|nr:amidohydrolase family protein [Spirochaetota bacterium]